MGNNRHPITGRQDTIRNDPSWRERVEYYESQLGHIICGNYIKASGMPCMNRPVEGMHRCEKHGKTANRKPQKSCYHSGVKYGMNTTGMIKCRRCKDSYCEARVNEGDDTCPLELKVYSDVMELNEKYNLSDTLEMGMLESVAQIFVKKYRCDRMIADEGMVVEDVMAFDKMTGEPITNSKEHPLLKTASSLNKELIAFADSLEFSPKAKSRKTKDEQVAQDSESFLKQIFQGAQKLRTGDD